MSDFDPYTPPAALIESLAVGPVRFTLASRKARLLARLVDLATQIAVFVPGVALALLALRNGKRLPDESLMVAAFVVTGVLLLALLGANCFLLDQLGQTLGKRALGIRIVALDGSKVLLLKLLTLRVGVMFFIELIPYGVGLGFGLLNVLLIFGEEQRCFHDRIAGTMVVKV